MATDGFSIPDLSQDQQDVFQQAFTKDLDHLKSSEKIRQPFLDTFLGLCQTSRVSLLTDEEAQALLQLSDPSEKRTATLNSVGDKGPRAILTFYLLLKMHNEATYGELPSSKEKDEKLELLSNLEDSFISLISKHVTQTQAAKFSASQGIAKPTASVATVKPFLPNKGDETEEKAKDETDSNKEVVKKEKESHRIAERHRGKKEEDKKPAGDQVDGPRPKSSRRSWGIRKDDEFFHFVIICFAVGAALVSSYNYADWTMSAGIGLISFASLETIGIYFGLVYRIRTVVEAFLPLFRKSPLTGFPKQQ
ncbi:hypothetical protein FKM82_004295 [Ascaphus truei]